MSSRKQSRVHPAPKTPTNHNRGPPDKSPGKPDSRPSPRKPVDKQVSNLSKTYMSKSHDNLASTLRRKAVQANISGSRPSSVVGVPKIDCWRTTNKENTKDRPGSARGKSLRPPPPGQLRKAQSTQNIERAGTPIKRAASTQNISSPIKKAASIHSLSKTQTLPMRKSSTSTTSSSSPLTKSTSIQNLNKTNQSVIRRATSTQNVSPQERSVRNRISAPANVMAYNAELLASFEKEKKSMDRRMSELVQLTENRKAEIEKYKIEIRNLRQKTPPVELVERFDLLKHENRCLKDRLSELGISTEHITDSEKLDLLQKMEDEPEGEHLDEAGDDTVPQRTSSQKSDSLAMGDTLRPPLSLDEFSCETPDHPSLFSLDNSSNWDRQSNKSSDAMSEISVACLQDRILQMEETHYSTSEELQATLQELTDLQSMVNELSGEVERLSDEKNVLLESLCAQTQKLENARTQIEHLKALILSDNDREGTRSDRENTLMDLLRSAQEEREELLLKQVEFSNVLTSIEQEYKEQQDVVRALKENSNLHQSKISSLTTEKHTLIEQVIELKERLSTEEIELTRYKTLLENEKSKVGELEQYRKAADKSEVEELLDSARQEKDKAEEKLANIQEALSRSEKEVTKLKNYISKMDDELKVTKNNSKSTASDLHYQIEQLQSEKLEWQQDADTLRDHIDTLEKDCNRYLEEIKSYKVNIQKIQSDMKKSEDKHESYKRDIEQMMRKHDEEAGEWRQFQMDLQKAVVIANNIKTETQEGMEQMTHDNAVMKHKIEHLTDELEKAHDDLEELRSLKSSGMSLLSSELKKKVLNTVDKELSQLRQGQRPYDSRQRRESASVKNIIRSIEDQVKGNSPVGSSQSSSRRGSLDSNAGSVCTSPGLSNISFKTEHTPKSTTEHRRSVTPTETSQLKGVLKKSDSKEKRPYYGQRSVIYEKSPSPATENMKSSNSRSETDSTFSTKQHRNSISEQDPLAGLVKQVGGSKRNALLKWCQSKTQNFKDVDVTNFSSSWNDGLAFCALLYNYMPNKIPFRELNADDKRRNFTVAFQAAESVGIPGMLNVNEMVSIERPDWQLVMSYVTAIYKHFEV